MFFTEHNRIYLVEAATAAGTTAIASATVDMNDDGGWESCTFITTFGTITGAGTATMYIKESTDDSSYASLATVTHSVAADDDNQTFVLEVRPKERYVQCHITRTDENSVVGEIYAILSRGRKESITQSVADTLTCIAADKPADA